MLIQGFTVFHKDNKLTIKLGRGFVVGEVQQKKTVATQGTVVENGVETVGVITQEEITTYYQVLWENARNVSPSLHLSTELSWEMLMDEYTQISTDEEEEEGEEEEEEEGVDYQFYDGNNSDDPTTTKV